MNNMETPEQKKQKQQMLDDNLNKIKNKIVVLSGKGGVGKSTVAVNLAYGLALAGNKVGILDVDFHGPSIAKMLNIEGKRLQVSADKKRAAPIQVHENLYALTIASMLEDADKPVVWRGPLKMGAIKQFMQDINWPELDYMVIDCPPGTGDEPLSVLQVLKNVDGSVIVSTPQDVAFLDVRKSITFSQEMKVPVLGIIENMSSFACPHCGEQVSIFEGTGADKAAKDFNLDILGNIPIDPNIAKTGDEGRPYIYDFGKKAAAKEMRKAVDRLIEKIDNK